MTTRSPKFDPDLPNLARRLADGDRRALASSLSVLESGGERADEMLELVAQLKRRASEPSYVLGLTGAPGSGKSTLVDALVASARARGERVAVIAVDPSSPLSAGAILGDRVRLRSANSSDDGVFMRSFASRGALGGLAAVVPGALRAIDAAGWPVILVETVGVGQSELAVAAQADTTVVVVNPDSGDEIQANKAGLLEMADIFVVNKADLAGADRTVRDLQAMLHLGSAKEWSTPVLTTVATQEQGIEAVWNAISQHQHFLDESGEGRVRRARSLRNEVTERVAAELHRRVALHQLSREGQAIVRDVETGKQDPVSAAKRILDALHREGRA
ncbi:MAG TPA: methylmalonyl Co-A mutase-associated GTPase MeaB [Acidimicrobiales bacterium]|nr:methylmalonyl Co-A mutase-associated GTPase MeaB [Acidimicrobiales bacterium]